MKIGHKQTTKKGMHWGKKIKQLAYMTARAFRG